MNQSSQSCYQSIIKSFQEALTPLFMSAAAISLLFGAGCNLNTEVVSAVPSWGDEGDYLEPPAGGVAPGAIFIDENFRGKKQSLIIERISWGRLVDIADGDGVIRHQDFVVSEGIQDGGFYSVETNPITDKTTVTINAEYQSMAYVDALDALDDNLGPIFDKGLDVDELPPFPIMPRNAVLSVQFNDLLDVRYESDGWEDSSSGLLVETSGQLNRMVLKVITDYPPNQPYEARVIVNSNYGDIADYDGDGVSEFHPTRVIVDMTVSELEAAVSDPPLTVNSVGLPSSLYGVNDANLAIRFATKTNATLGQTILLTNPTDNALDYQENGSYDVHIETEDIVRAMRSGSSTDMNNGFIGDTDQPQIIAA